MPPINLELILDTENSTIDQTAQKILVLSFTIKLSLELISDIIENQCLQFLYLNQTSKFMTIKLRCNDYGYECDLVLDEELTVGLIKKLRDHFEEEHGLDYTIGAVTQMITNRGHSLESIKKE